MASDVLLVAAIAGLVALALLWWARSLRRESGLPVGRVTYADTGAWERCERPLFSRRHRLTGRPDYLVRTRRGLVPVEIKSGPAPAEPYPAHVLQLGAYCLLVEEQEAKAPPYGIIRYRDRALEVDYTAGLREEVLRAVEAMRGALGATTVGRSHDERARCRACGYRQGCQERLG